MTTIKFRKNTAANAAASNPTLAAGEPGFETDTGKWKIGNGSTAWNSLPYQGSGAWSDITGKPTTLSGYGITDAQPLDSDLTAIAALTTTTFGRSLLTQADAAATRSTIGLGSLATQSGIFSGTSSGTNTGDQTITLTGDVTGTGTGSFATTIGAGKVTNAMLAGSIDLTAKVTGALPIANGGTGQTTANAALNALLPSQTGNANKFLQTDGSNTSWAAPPAALPIGTIIDYGASSLPSGYLACDGSAVSRTTYADLYTAIGTTWGVGDGSTTFNVPDLRGRTVIGSGTGSGLTARTLAGTGGAEAHQLTTAEMPSHVHGTNALGFNPATGTGAASWTSGNRNVFQPATGSAGSDGAHNNMQPFSVVTKAIKALDVAGGGSGTAVGPPPGAPTGLTATATGTSGQLALSWTAPAFAPGTPSQATPTDYLVEYSTSSSFTSPTRVVSSGTGTTKTVTGLTNGTTYYVRVAALANWLYGAYSGSASAAPVTYLIHDTFTATNGTSPTGRSPDIGSAPTTALLGSWTINSGAVAASGSGQTALIYNPGTATQTVEANVTGVGTGANGSGAYLYARWTNSSNYYAALFDVAYNNVAIYKTVGGTSTLLGSAGTFGAGAAVLKFEVIGTALKAYVNGSVVASVTDSSLTTGNYAGVGDFYGSFNYNFHPTFDNLKVY